MHISHKRNTVKGIPVTAQVNAGAGGATEPEPPAKPKPRPSATYLWAALIARIYEVFPLLRPNCGGQMRIVWLLSIPLRLIGIGVGAVLALIKSILFLPARILGYRTHP